MASVLVVVMEVVVVVVVAVVVVVVVVVCRGELGPEMAPCAACGRNVKSLYYPLLGTFPKVSFPTVQARNGSSEVQAVQVQCWPSKSCVEQMRSAEPAGGKLSKHI